jgi:hypothetical protein
MIENLPLLKLYRNEIQYILGISSKNSKKSY